MTSKYNKNPDGTSPTHLSRTPRNEPPLRLRQSLGPLSERLLPQLPPPLEPSPRLLLRTLVHLRPRKRDTPPHRFLLQLQATGTYSYGSSFKDRKADSGNKRIGKRPAFPTDAVGGSLLISSLSSLPNDPCALKPLVTQCTL